MKKILLLLLSTQLTFSQNNAVTYERFSIVNNNIIWQNVYEKDSVYSIENLKKQPKFKFSSDYTGNVTNQKVICKGRAMYMHSSFGFGFFIEEKDNKYRITVSDIYFDDNLQFSGYGIVTANKIYLLEEFEFDKKNLSFKRYGINKKNMNCLDEFFINFFSLTSNNSW